LFVAIFNVSVLSVYIYLSVVNTEVIQYWCRKWASTIIGL